ncbi:MAG: hypothetical protein ACJ76F_00935 [Bacteroidia bacterium]
MKKNRGSFYTSWTDEYGISHVEYDPETEIDIEKAKQIVSYGRQKFPEVRLYILNDLRNLHSISAEALEYIASRPVAKIKGAEAFVITNLSSRMLINFYLNKNPDVITHKFDNVTDALAWLLKEKAKAGD